MGIFTLLYWIAGYWAAGKVLYENKIVIYSGNALFVRKAGLGLLLGWAFIPIAIFKAITGR